MGTLENLIGLGGTIIAGGLLLKATDIMFQKPKGKRISLYDMAYRTKSIHDRAKKKAKKVV
jgi:hypothetical protein